MLAVIRTQKSTHMAEAKDAYELGYERGRQAEKINLVADLEKYSVDIYSEAGECWERYVYLDTVKKIVKGGAE